MRRYEEDRARVTARQERREADGTREASAATRARVGWLLLGLLVIGFSVLTDMVYGIVPALVVAVLLSAGIGVVLRVLR